MPKTKGKAAKKRTPEEREYDVNVIRTGYANLTIRVTATSAKQAKELALEDAGDHLFSEHDAEYDADYPVLVKKD